MTGTVNYTGTVHFYDTGETHLILADGCQMNIGTSENPINGEGMKYSGNPDLIICGQSAGSGTLGVYTTGESNYGIRANNITINGGHVIANTVGEDATALRADDITINGGTVTANATRIAIDTTKAYYFSWRNPTDRITIGTTGISNPTDAYSTPVTVTFSKAFTDGTTNYSGTLNSDVMLDAPGPIDQQQLDELRITVKGI